MKKLCWLMMLPLLLAACSAPEAPKAPEPAAFTPQPYANLVQVMRTFPFPNSNIIFDTQSTDPAAPKKATGGDNASSQYGSVYAGWEAVESSSMAIAETANLIMVPGRLCSNGKPVPVEREDYKKFAMALVDAGKASLEAAKTKNMDKMVEVSGTLSDACLNCHMVYRDKPDLKDRCIP